MMLMRSKEIIKVNSINRTNGFILSISLFLYKLFFELLSIHSLQSMAITVDKCSNITGL